MLDGNLPSLNRKGISASEIWRFTTPINIFMIAKMSNLNFNVNWIIPIWKSNTHLAITIHVWINIWRFISTCFPLLFISNIRIKNAVSALCCIKFVKSSTLYSTSLLSLCPQLAARLGRRPAPGNLCTITYADLAAAGHHVCSRMWALGRCYEGGNDGGMLQAKKERKKKLEQKSSMKCTEA